MAEFKVTLERFQGEQAVLKLPDGQELLIATALLPAGKGEGSVLSLGLSAEPAESEDSAAMARQLLTELLQGSIEPAHEAA